ncbi:CCC motif membrane protein [uncultured Lutibacter sp.]|uniref:CCC motif membrane protein n=1 Tax=uncultured Lutibacter sp. TaxID=437739 RepID=UPI00262B03E9|nr:CCC motif membrane protein [uncultured Lutibacter sp.]
MEKQKLPHAQNSLIFGIISIVTACCCMGLPGLIFGFIGLSNSKKAMAIYNEDPSLYTGEGNANTGKITSIIGIVIGAIAVLQLLYAIFSGSWQEQMDMYKELIEQAS